MPTHRAHAQHLGPSLNSSPGQSLAWQGHPRTCGKGSVPPPPTAIVSLSVSATVSASASLGGYHSNQGERGANAGGGDAWHVQKGAREESQRPDLDVPSSWEDHPAASGPPR